MTRPVYGIIIIDDLSGRSLSDVLPPDIKYQYSSFTGIPILSYVLYKTGFVDSRHYTCLQFDLANEDIIPTCSYIKLFCPVPIIFYQLGDRENLLWACHSWGKIQHYFNLLLEDFFPADLHCFRHQYFRNPSTSGFSCSDDILNTKIRRHYQKFRRFFNDKPVSRDVANELLRLVLDDLNDYLLINIRIIGWD